MSDYQKTSVQHLIKEKAGAVGKKVRLEGWVRSNRSQKEFGFIVLNDGSFFESMQIVYDQSLENWQEAAKIRVGSAVTVDGEVVLSPKEAQPIEIKAHKIVLEGDSPEDYPIQPKRHTREFLRKNAHLRARTNLFYAVFKVRSLLAFAIHKFFNEKGFIYVHSPLITSNDGEGAGQMFQVTTLDLERIAKSGEVDYSKDFFGKSQPYRYRPTGSRNICAGVQKGLYFRADFPGRKLQHHPPCLRILDD